MTTPTIYPTRDEAISKSLKPILEREDGEWTDEQIAALARIVIAEHEGGFVFAFRHIEDPTTADEECICGETWAGLVHAFGPLSANTTWRLTLRDDNEAGEQFCVITGDGMNAGGFVVRSGHSPLEAAVEFGWRIVREGKPLDWPMLAVVAR